MNECMSGAESSKLWKYINIRGLNSHERNSVLWNSLFMFISKSSLLNTMMYEPKFACLFY